MDLIIKILVCSVLLDHNFGQDTSTQQSTVSTPPPPLLPAYDVKNLPSELRPLAFLVGKWRSDFDGKIRFPTIPVFTYGEELDISIAEKTFQGPPALNYSAFAWGINNQESLHAENGFIVMKGATHLVLTTTMVNGFVTVEEGEIGGNRITLKLTDIGRISWSRDLPVLDLRREFELVTDGLLDQRLLMETLTNTLQEHAYVRYKKIYPL